MKQVNKIKKKNKERKKWEEIEICSEIKFEIKNKIPKELNLLQNMSEKVGNNILCNDKLCEN